MKMTKERPPRTQESREGRKQRKDSGRPLFTKGAGKPADKFVDPDLFEVLRKLRREIANELGIPAFVVFSDSTLTDMCAKVPTTREEFLNVSGVGEIKLGRFGERFLGAINEYLPLCGVVEKRA
jgi:ATP-dependent DNA helicase RecQ